jgi:hypothetical protein
LYGPYNLPYKFKNRPGESTNLKRFPTYMMLESGPIRLVRPSAVSITHKMLAPGPTLENCIHKDRRRNVGCVHHRKMRRVILYNLREKSAANLNF